ncbi:MAG: hypothetical protein WBA74_03020 [Cyclobacteriaceae bacterium]
MANKNKFGTFGGVFVPSILTILGVIMYLRLPTIVGEAGLWVTIGIIVVAHIISATTGLSVSSIATDKKVEAGGTYYMISRSMGLPIGGTIGIALFVGLSFSVSLYLIGFSESVISALGGTDYAIEMTINNIRIIGSAILMAITVLTFISTSLAIKIQYIILGLIALSLVSIFAGTGNHDYVATQPVFTNPSSSVSIMILFGIFFPAVTGFEAGVSMSGDLKDPKKSIPGGSIMAIVVGFVVYIGLAFYLAYTVDVSLLTDKTGKTPMTEIAWIPQLVVMGILGATFSSALGSILGAPRILQATAVDKISHSIFAKGSGKTNEPRNALLLTFVIAEAGILIGELDVIARIVSVFFITTYGFVNISATFEKWTSTDFNPEFKVSGWVSFIGAMACILVMIEVDFEAMLGTSILLAGLFFYLKNKELKLESGDAWSGVWASLVKTGLARLTKNKIHNRNWRPNVIMFSGNPNTRKYMIQMGKAISGKLGILSAFELVEGGSKILAKTSSNLYEDENTIGYFHYRFTCKDVYTGMDSISRIYGFSGVEPNTILMGWSRNPRNKDQFIDLLKGFDQNGYSSIFLDYNLEKKFGSNSTVDIWWSGLDKNLAFAVKILKHIAASEIWKSCYTRLLVINPVNAETESVYRSTTAILKGFRVDAEVKIINNEIDTRTRKDIIHEESRDTDLVIVGISDNEYKNLGEHYDEISDILDGVGSSLVINASRVFEEFEVISTSSPKGSDAIINAVEMELPEIKLSEYPEIVTDILKIEKNGLKVLELFYRKTFVQVGRDHAEITDELKKRVDIAKKELSKITELAEQIRRNKAIDKLKNDTFYKVNTLLKDELSGETLKTNVENIGNGISWYVERLKTELKKYPIKLKIAYKDEDFKINKSDRTGLKFIKTWKQFKQRFTKKPITQHVDYRNAAKYYQYQKRLLFMDSYLEKFMAEEVAFFDRVRYLTNSLFDCLDNYERKINANQEGWNSTESLDELEKKVNSLIRQRELLDQTRQGRLKLEFIKNLQLMNNHLSRVDVDKEIRDRLSKDRQIREIEAELLDFNEVYETRVQTTLNLILMELSVNATRNRMDAIQDDLLIEVEQTIERKYLRELEAMAEELDDKQLPEQEKSVAGVEIQPQLREMLVNTIGRMSPLIDEMPEKLEIYSFENSSTEEESVEIPVTKMMDYYFKSRFQLPLEEEFEEITESLKRSAYSVRDIINLTEVSIQSNVANDKTIQEDELYVEAAKKIRQEITSIRNQIKDFREESDKKFESVFFPLSSLRIEESAGEFSSGLMAYQGKQVLTGVNRLYVSTTNWFQKMISQLFYRRSEGILITRKIQKSVDHRSLTSKMLDLKEKVNPDKSVLSLLPHYYLTLFNGKSSIGRDFWVDRPAEEDIFKKALKRYRDGYKGGILVIGGHNSGKSTFCRQMSLDHFKNQYVYNVIPPMQGSSDPADFHKAIAKATQKRGEAFQVLGRLPAGSTVIINDLELFWDSTENGNTVIQMLSDIIDQYSRKILFIVNINKFAWKAINEPNHLSQYFIEEITLMPFDAEELRDLIIHRHRSSGMEIGYSADELLTEVQLARLFNRYFNYSQGVPGTALGGWLANIKKISGNKLLINSPENLDMEAFKEIENDWQEILKSLLIHKRMDQETIGKVMNWDEDKVETIVLALQRAGLVYETIP